MQRFLGLKAALGSIPASGRGFTYLFIYLFISVWVENIGQVRVVYTLTGASLLHKSELWSNVIFITKILVCQCLNYFNGLNCGIRACKYCCGQCKKGLDPLNLPVSKDFAEWHHLVIDHQVESYNWWSTSSICVIFW